MLAVRKIALGPHCPDPTPDKLLSDAWIERCKEVNHICFIGALRNGYYI